MCFTLLPRPSPPLVASFSSVTSRGVFSARLFPLFLPPALSSSLSSVLLGSSVISITTLYATLIIVGVMSSRKSSKTQPRGIPLSRCASSLSLLLSRFRNFSLSRSTIRSMSLSFSFPLVSSAECQRAPLSSFSGRIPRESPHHRVLPRS